MPPVSLFEPLPGSGEPTVEIQIDGRPHRVPSHYTVAAAMLAAGVTTCGTRPGGDAQRAPFCLMGLCFECLVEIDGIPNRHGCMTRVSPGMQVRSMHGQPELA
jgi:predicted molibdopterin-dependent oxidoreductase YjgC